MGWDQKSFVVVSFGVMRLYWNVGDCTILDAINKYIETGNKGVKESRSKLKNLILNKFLVYRAAVCTFPVACNRGKPLKFWFLPYLSLILLSADYTRMSYIFSI